MHQGPLWIVEPPLSTGERMSVNDPLRPVAVVESSRSIVRRALRPKPTFSHDQPVRRARNNVQPSVMRDLEISRNPASVIHARY